MENGGSIEGDSRCVVFMYEVRTAAGACVVGALIWRGWCPDNGAETADRGVQGQGGASRCVQGGDRTGSRGWRRGRVAAERMARGMAWGPVGGGWRMHLGFGGALVPWPYSLRSTTADYCRHSGRVDEPEDTLWACGRVHTRTSVLRTRERTTSTDWSALWQQLGGEPRGPGPTAGWPCRRAVQRPSAEYGYAQSHGILGRDWLPYGIATGASALVRWLKGHQRSRLRRPYWLWPSRLC